MSHYMATLACRFHPSAPLIEDHRAGDMICPECGLVVGERMIDVSETWPTSSDNDDKKDKSRVGAAQNLLYGFDCLETAVPKLKPITPINQSERQIYNSTAIRTSPEEAELLKSHQAIRLAALGMGITKQVSDQALLVYKQCYEKKCLSGNKKEVIIGCCIYIACRQKNSTRSIKEIVAHLGLSDKDFQRCFLKMKNSLKDSLLARGTDIKELVPRFCNRLSLNNESLVRNTTIHIIQCVDKLANVQGRSPISIASAAIYLTCLATRENITKTDIKKATGAAESTTRILYKMLLPHVTELFPSNFQFQLPINQFPKV